MPSKEPRPPIVGEDSGPTPPFPLKMNGIIISGFGRGSKDLGIPTANVPIENAPWITDAATGVYYGWAGVKLPPTCAAVAGTSYEVEAGLPADKQAAGWRVFAVAMSIGYNPFYKNTVKTAEGHIIAKFPADFYDSPITVSLLGYIRPELDYVSKELLIADIQEDIAVALRSLDRPAYKALLKDDYLWTEPENQA